MHRGNIISMKSISIIGGGISGALVVMNLLRIAQKDTVSIKWIEQSGSFGLGTAYSTDKAYHLLNVPAIAMGLFPDNPGGFYEWLKEKGHTYAEYDFVPRMIYGQYIKENLDSFLQNNQSVTLALITAEVNDVSRVGDQYSLSLANHDDILTDSVVLVPGNFLPAHPRVENMAYALSPGYHRNPWDNGLNDTLKKSDDVLVIGTGLTMVDKILDFYHQSHKGNIYALSRNGYLPLSHNPGSRHQKYPDYKEEMLVAGDAGKLLSIVRKHITKGIKSVIDWRVVLDSLRPSIPAIWNTLSLKEKQRFFRHINAAWAVARHRIPVICADIIQILRAKKQLDILSGRLIAIKPETDGFTVTYRDRKTLEIKSIAIHKIINCTGPQIYPGPDDSLLMRNLFAKEWVCADELGLGYNVLPDGRLLNKTHQILPNFYTIGSGLKGVLFETTAVPEIRAQANTLSKLLLETEI